MPMSVSATRRKAPGPPGRPLIGNLLEFRRDVLGALMESRQRYGDVVRFRLGPKIVHLVAGPEQIEYVLLTRHENYNKNTRSSSKIRSVTGQGLLTSNGDFWLRQRRLTQPIFARERLEGFLEIMTSTTGEMLDRWGALSRQGKPVDVASEMMRLTCTIIGKALFGTDVSSDLETIAESATVLMSHAWRRLERIVDPGVRLPTPANRRFHRALRRLNQVVYRIINERRTAERGDDLLSMLLARSDEHTGQRMSDAEVRNETITLLLAGHETTANALTWAWYLLSQHPEVALRAREETTAVLGGRPRAIEDLSRLEYTNRLLRESLRLYPPIWIMERQAIADDTIGGFHIPAGSSVVISPYVTHRHPGFWYDPERFDADRFLPEPSAGRAAHAYIPFGGGQRLCIGSSFATAEALVILAMVLQRYRLELVPGHPVSAKPGITLRTMHGLLMSLKSL